MSEKRNLSHEMLEYGALLNARSWGELDAECKALGLYASEPGLLDFIPVGSDRFTEYVNVLLENGFPYFFNRLMELLRQTTMECECVIKVTEGGPYGTSYFTDRVRPATEEDFRKFRRLAADVYAECAGIPVECSRTA